MSNPNKPSLQYVVDCYCSHIHHPFTLEEIVQKIESGTYNAELLLQHLLVWVGENMRNASPSATPNAKDSHES